jgi:hypothetical protein
VTPARRQQWRALFLRTNIIVMNTVPATPLISVMHNGRCLGFLLYRGRQGVEAFTRETQSIGIFSTEHEAVGALLNPKGARL